MRMRTVVSLVAAFGVTGACVNIFWRTEPNRIPIGTEQYVTTPLKVHMTNGSTVIFERGAQVSRDRIQGAGVAYALLSDAGTSRDAVPMDSVVALETFEGKVLAAPTAIVSIAATAIGTLGTVAILKAIFGSCPTVYADTGTGPILEAEGFSYAIAPLFEHRDVDRLRARPDRDGVLRLELRNEALETHYINHVELAEVQHAAGTRALPDHEGRIVAAGDVRAPLRAIDRSGRDVSALLAESDGQLYSTPATVVDAASARDVNDWLDLEIGDLPPGDSIAVVLRLRNSLLNTVLLYDEMLGGPDALHWIGSQLQQISTAVQLSRWYVKTMGLHITTGESAKTAARLNDVGPLAFRDVAVIVPRPRADRDGTVRVRLRFVADNWRIDYAAIAGIISRPATTVVPVARVVVPAPARGGPPVVDSAAVRALADPDERYLQTLPGQRMTLEFKTAASRGEMETTYLIAWQGWYSEWIRRDWIRNPTRTTAFVASNSTLLSALHKWRARQTEFERAFYETRIPVR